MIYINRYLMFILLLVASSLSIGQESLIAVNIETEIGIIQAELYPDKAPIAVNNFIENIRAGLYINSEFFRSVHRSQRLADSNTGFSLIEARTSNKISERKPIFHESTQDTGIKNEQWVLSMSRDEPGTAAADFFINTESNPVLDYSHTAGQESLGFTAFGRVVKGMDLVQKINDMPAGLGKINAEEIEALNQLSKSDPQMTNWYKRQLLDHDVLIFNITIQQ